MKRRFDHSETAVLHVGRSPHDYAGVVNPPVVRGSTILFESVQALHRAESQWHSAPYYGRHGTPPTFAFEQAIADLEGGHRAVAVSSGLAAITTALSSFVSQGDHLLMVDTVYGPTRKFCDGLLRRFGVETTYYPPDIGAADLAALLRPTTRVVYVESPGSLTFDMQDIPALAAVAHAHGAVVILDNTWGTPLYFKAFQHGVDVSVHAATKYIVGHSDALLGVVVASEKHFMTVKQTAALYGHHAAPDDIYLAQRGLRTMAIRLERHAANALALCDWLLVQPEVARILNPAHPSDPGHALWQRDFTGGCGLFGCVFRQGITTRQVTVFVESLHLFGLGFSWGGYESLVLPVDLRTARTATRWQDGPVVRLHAGLEHMDDLRDDLARGLAALRTAGEHAA
jgi:cysteine-S-conjugate beta-lyase